MDGSSETYTYTHENFLMEIDLKSNRCVADVTLWFP